ncbi:MAG: hypothetical protein AAGA56_22625 [Myxococcota bacterium]
MARGWFIIASGFVFAITHGACLPPDNRPEPAEVLVDVVRSDAAISGFETDDGWTIRFTRFVTALGGLGLGEGDSCNDYSSTFYDRLIDFAVADTAKLHLHFGLGTCSPVYRMGPPAIDTIVGPGVTEADLERMRDPGDDRVFGNEEEGDEQENATDLRSPLATDTSGIGLIVIGRANGPGGQAKRFAWEIRSQHFLTQCYVANEDPTLPRGDPFEFAFEGGQQVNLQAEVRPRELFRETPSLASRIVFQRYADADADGDGEVTLEELDAAILDAEELEALVEDWQDELPTSSLGNRSFEELLERTEVTLKDVVQGVLMPRVSAYVGVGECEAVSEGIDQVFRVGDDDD